MIVALTGMDGDGAVSDDPQLFDDLLIDASHRGEDRALERAMVIVVLLRPEELERGSLQLLLERLHKAQHANPGAQVLVTVAHGRRPLSPHQTGCVLVFVAQLRQARLADTSVLDDGGDSYHSHHSELEPDAYKMDRKLCAPEVRHLYREIFPSRSEDMYIGALFSRQAV
jgi:hypothetical protein